MSSSSSFSVRTKSTTSSTTELTSIPSSVYIVSSDGRTIRLPIPSISPKDPLNWSLSKRCAAFASLWFFTAVTLTQSLGSGVILPELQVEYVNADTRPFTVELLASGGSLFTGLGAFLWVPLSIAIGRRTVFLICNIIVVLGTFGAAMSQSYYQHLLAVCLQGLALGIMPSLIILMIIDITFIHQRIMAISLFSTLCGVSSNTFLTSVPLIINKFDSSWRVFYWVGVGPAVVSLLIAIFFCPETYFRRPPVAFDGRIIAQTSAEKVVIYQSWSDIDEEKQLPAVPLSQTRRWLNGLKFWGNTTKDGWREMGHCYMQILFMFFNPLVVWVMLLKALILGSFIAFGVTYPQLLSAPPYNLPIEKLVLIYLSAAAGAFLSFPLAGPIMTRISLGLASRNGGKQNAEHYLAGFIVPILLGFGGQLLYGFAGQHQLPLWVIFVSYGMIALSFVCLYTATALWSTEAFPRWSAASVVVVSGGAYVFSFAFSFAIIPWIQNEGFLKANGELAGVFLIIGCAGIPIAIWGKRFRGYIEHRWGESEAGALRPQ